MLLLLSKYHFIKLNLEFNLMLTFMQPTGKVSISSGKLSETCENAQETGEAVRGGGKENTQGMQCQKKKQKVQKKR